MVWLASLIIVIVFGVPLLIRILNIIVFLFQEYPKSCWSIVLIPVAFILILVFLAVVSQFTADEIYNGILIIGLFVFVISFNKIMVACDDWITEKLKNRKEIRNKK